MTQNKESKEGRKSESMKTMRMEADGEFSGILARECRILQRA